MQEEYIQNKYPDSITQDLLNNVNSVIRKFDTKNLIYVKSEMIVASLSFKGITMDTLANLDFCHVLKVVNSKIYIKENGNAFSNSELLSCPKRLNAREIIIIGLMAEKCVKKTSIGGLELGF